MVAIVIALIAGYAPMGIAIGVLYRDLRASQQKRLDDAEENERKMLELHEIVLRNRFGGKKP